MKWKFIDEMSVFRLLIVRMIDWKFCSKIISQSFDVTVLFFIDTKGDELAFSSYLG